MNKKGFTLAELLIVVAIIAILVAIAIPVFGAQLDKAKIATEQANARSTYAQAVAAFLNDGSTVSLVKEYDGVTYTASGFSDGSSWNVSLTGKKSSPKGSSVYSFS